MKKFSISGKHHFLDESVKEKGSHDMVRIFRNGRLRRDILKCRVGMKRENLDYNIFLDNEGSDVKP